MTLELADSHTPVASRDQRKWRLFTGLMLFTTLLPFLIMPVSVEFGTDENMLLLASAALSFLGGHAHVASTAFFYTDPVMRKHFGDHKLRYIVFPVLLIGGTGLAFMLLAPPYDRYILLCYFMWQTYHYQRQNYGILSFFAAATDQAPVSKIERLCLELAVVSGMLALIRIYSLSDQTFLAPYADSIFQLGALVYLSVPILLCSALFIQPGLRKNPLRLTVLILSSAFYLPSFIFKDPAAATLGYALGHGLQYLVFMYFVGVSRPRPQIAILSTIAFAAIGGLALTYTTKQMGQAGPLSHLLFGMGIGVVMTHFVIDAGIWRLRHSFQRQYVRQAFSFIFNRPQT
jgi:hypothetical protein